MSQEHSRKALRIADQIEDYLFTGALADLVKGVSLGHFFGRDRGVHAACKYQAIGIDLLEDLSGFQGDRKSVAAHIHQCHLVAAKFRGQLFPRGDGPRGNDVGLQAILMHNRAQEPKTVVLPLFVGTLRVYQITKIAQVDPDDVALTFPATLPVQLQRTLLQLPIGI